MVERFSMNPISCKLLNEAWEKEFPDEVAIAKRMLALLDELEAAEKRIAELQSINDELTTFPAQIVSYVARLWASEIGSHTKNVIYRAAQKVKDSAAGISIKGSE